MGGPLRDRKRDQHRQRHQHGNDRGPFQTTTGGGLYGVEGCDGALHTRYTQPASQFRDILRRCHAFDIFRPKNDTRRTYIRTCQSTRLFFPPTFTDKMKRKRNLRFIADEAGSDLRRAAELVDEAVEHINALETGLLEYENYTTTEKKAGVRQLLTTLYQNLLHPTREALTDTLRVLEGAADAMDGTFSTLDDFEGEVHRLNTRIRPVSDTNRQDRIRIAEAARESRPASPRTRSPNRPPHTYSTTGGIHPSMFPGKRVESGSRESDRLKYLRARLRRTDLQPHTRRRIQNEITALEGLVHNRRVYGR